VHVDDLIREDVLYVNSRATPARPPRLPVPMFDERGLVRGGGEFGACDPQIRLQQMDAEGIAGELLLPGTQVATLPFFGTVNAPWPAEIRAAGARLPPLAADFMGKGDGACSASPSWPASTWMPRSPNWSGCATASCRGAPEHQRS
jgi:hypothetical protein